MVESPGTYRVDEAPAEATQVVQPVRLEPVSAGETAVLEPVAEAAKPEKAAAPKKKRRWPVGVIVALVVILGAAAALEFVPGSPLEYTIRDLFAPEPTVFANPASKADLPAVEEEEHCRALELKLVFLVPDSVLPAIPGPAAEEAGPEAPSEGTAGEAEEPPVPEPTAAERYIEALQRAAEKLNSGTAKTTPIKISVKPVEYVEEEAPAPAFTYRTSAMAQRVAKAAQDARAAAMAEAVVTIPAAAMLSCICYDPGVFDVSPVGAIVDSSGFVWIPRDETVRVELLEDRQVEIVYIPADLTVMGDEEFASYKAGAGEYTEALAVMRALALEAVAEPEAGEESENPDETDEPEDPGATEQPGGQGTTPGGQGSGSGSSGGNSGSGTGTGTGSGSGSGSGNGSGSGGGETAHTHTLATREVCIGTQQITVVDVPGHYGTVHHDAVYNDWTEAIDVCNDCGAHLGVGEAGNHLIVTGHSGYHSEHIYHHDLVSEAYDSEEWIPDQTHVETYAMFVTETYCIICGEVTATSEPYHY